MDNHKEALPAISKKYRSSNLELLRVLSIIMIVAYHYCLHSHDANMFWSTFSINQCFAVAFGSWGILGVYCFFLISIYFSLKPHKLKLSKFTNILLQTFFYSIFFALVLYGTGVLPHHGKALIKEILSPLPATDNSYWYVTAFLALMLLSPLLNRVISHIKNWQHLCLIALFFILVPIYKSFFNQDLDLVFDILLVIFTYLVMAWLKVHPNNFLERHCGAGFLITYFATLSIDIAILYYRTQSGTHFARRIGYITYYVIRGRYSAITLLLGIFLFYWFKKLKMKQHPFINYLATTTLGIYLIHENPTLRHILWTKILHPGWWFGKSYFLFGFILEVSLLLTMCVLLESARAFVFKKVFRLH